MRRLFGCLLLIVMLIGAFFFVRGWFHSTPWGAGTGTIGRDVRGGSGSGPVSNSTLVQVANAPEKFRGQRVTVRGRVRGATKIASNRNLYILTEGDKRVLIIDDKAFPKDYWPRTVKGEVRVISAPVGSLSYAYIVDAKPGVKIDAPRWQDVARFFTQKYDEVKSGVDRELSSR